MTSIFILFQVVFAVLLITFIVFPQIKPPFYIVSFIHSTLGGIIGILLAIILVFLLFVYTNPILGILAIISFYVLYLRINEKIARVQQTQETVNLEMAQMNTPQPGVTVDTLEEYIVGIMAPIVPPPVSDYYYTQFKPVNEPIGTASML